MSQTSDETPTGPIGSSTGMLGPHPTDRVATEDLARRWNVRRDLAGGLLVVFAAFLPWNLYFGVGIAGSNGTLFALLTVVTLLSLAAIAVTHAGPGKSSRLRFNPALAGRLRLGLNLPYLLLVIGFIVFDSLETIRFGGSVNVPGGVGPGAWLGVAGALLIAQPVLTGPAAEDERFAKWLKTARVVGYASMVGAALTTGFHLCWRIRYALNGPDGSSGVGKQDVAVIATATVYGLVALAAVLVASREIVRHSKASRLATIAVGLSSLVAGIIVWILPIGRNIDAFHGIAQNTSTAGVGYEGYLAWAAAAAIFTAPTLFSSSSTTASDESAWRTAARKGLLLIAIWGLGSVLMRTTDLLVGVTLNYPFSRYDTMTLAAFDLVTAIIALWLRINLANESQSPRLVTALCGLLSTFTIARVVVGILLAPRFQESTVGHNPVYGNDLAQQITSTFDVMLCGLALCILGAAVQTGQLRDRLRQRRARRDAHGRNAKRAATPGRPIATPRPGAALPPAPSVPSAAPTTRFSTDATGGSPTTVLPGSAGSPRIFRGDDSATRQIPVKTETPKIYRRPPRHPR